MTMTFVAVRPRNVVGAVLFMMAALASAGCCKNKKPAALPGGETSGARLAVEAGAPEAARGTTKRDCDACSGRWGRHGIAEVESCVCKTSDGGKVCRDGSECKGQCLASDDGGFEVKESGPPPKGYWRGKCSEYETTFGCNRTIPTGATSRPPQVAEDAADTICVD